MKLEKKEKKTPTWKRAPDPNCSAFVCARFRERNRGRSGEVEEGGEEVYELLNARLATGGSSSVDPIKTRQKWRVCSAAL